MNLNFFYKPEKKPKVNLDSDFLLPQDKKEIKKLVEVKSKQLQNISEINHKIALIQDSTGTLVPRFVRLHNDLRAKYRWYYNWHTKPYAKSVHWLVLLLYLIALPFVYSLLSTNIHKAKATTYDFPRWEWSNAKPTSAWLNRVDRCSDDNSLWAVGQGGTIVKSSDLGENWQVEYSGVSNELYDIECISGDNIYAVGGGGKILHYNGISWTPQTSGTTNDLRGISAYDMNTIYIVGMGGKVLRLNNGLWEIMVSGTTSDLSDVITISSASAWATSWDKKVYRYDGNSWTGMNVGSTEFLTAISGTSGNNIWAVGWSGTAFQYNGSSWVSKGPGGFQNISGVYVVNENNIYVACGNSVMKYNGSTWNTEYTEASRSFRAIEYINSNFIIVVGDRGQIKKYNGASWQTKSSGVYHGFSDIKAFSSTNIWAVGVDQSGSSGAMVHNNGTGWSNASYGSTQSLSKVSALDANNIWAVGSDGVIKYNGSDWSSQVTGSILFGVYALDANNVWAVGDAGTILKYNGTTWANQSYPILGSLYAVYALDANNVWAVGQSGKILKYNGTTWSAQTSGTTKDLLDVYASSTSSAWAVGLSGKILKYNGTTWSAQTSGTTNDLSAIKAIDSNNIWAAGSDGTVLKYNGSAWSTSASLSIPNISGISILSANDIYIAGDGGGIRHYTSPANATATKFLVKLPGQSFADGVGVSGTPNTVQAGDDVTATIYAVDGSNILDKGNASIAGFTSTDPNDSNPASVQLTQGGTCVQTNRQPGDPECGIGTATFVFHTTGTWTVTALDTNGVLTAGISSSITVSPGDPAKLAFSNLPTSCLNLGSASGAMTVGVKDAYGNATTISNSQTIRLVTNSGDGRFSTSPNGPWTKGQLDVTISSGSSSTTFYYLDFRTGSSTITATETPDAGWTDVSGTFSICTGSLSQSTLSLSSNSLSSCGGTVTATVTLKNSEGLALTDRTVQLQSSRTTETISPASAITDSLGIATFTISSSSSGDLTITAYDQTDNSYLPQTQDVHVASSGLTKISLSSNSSTVAAGSSFDLSTTLYNACDGIISDYTGEMQFTSSDSNAGFDHTHYTFSTSDGGKNTQSVTLEKEGEQSISASAGGVTGTVLVTVTAATPIPGTTTSTPSTSPSVTTSPAITEEPKSLVETFQESPVAQAISKALTPIMATVATLGIFPLLVQAFPQGFHVLASLFPTIFTAAAIRRRRKPWGNVYDSLTGQPVDLAIVRVFNASNDRLVATKVTDENGRFNFLLSKGKYYVKVVKSGFSFPPKISKLKASQLSTRFGPQSDIYFGQSFVIGEDDTNLNLNIALDPKIATLSFGTKLLMWTKNGLDWFLIALSYFAIPLMLVGAAFAGLATVIIPSKFNFYMSGAYVLLLVAYLISSRIKATRVGIVFNAKSRLPVAGATVLIFDKEYNAIREIKTTDQHGHFAILAQKGQYYLTVHAQGYKFPSKEFKFQKGDKKLGTLYLGQTINNKKAGFVNVSIPLDKV